MNRTDPSGHGGPGIVALVSPPVLIAVAATYFLSWGPDAAQNRANVANAIDNLADSISQMSKGKFRDSTPDRVNKAIESPFIRSFEHLPESMKPLMDKCKKNKVGCVLIVTVLAACLTGHCQDLEEGGLSEEGHNSEGEIEPPAKSEGTDGADHASEPATVGQATTPDAAGAGPSQFSPDNVQQDDSAGSSDASSDHWWPDWY